MPSPAKPQERVIKAQRKWDGDESTHAYATYKL